MPVHILPGDMDPAGAILPQQPFPRGMFGAAASFPSLCCETNPTYLRVAPGMPDDAAESKTHRTLLINSGQPLNDMFKYLPSTHTRLGVLESTLRWRHIAPTAPDTLWCHPYFGEDPFVIKETPALYIVGGQAKFGTKLVAGKIDDGGDEKTRCRIVLVPSFAKTGVLVLVNLRSLAVKTVVFSVVGMTGDGKDVDYERKFCHYPTHIAR